MNWGKFRKELVILAKEANSLYNFISEDKISAARLKTTLSVGFLISQSVSSYGSRGGSGNRLNY